MFKEISDITEVKTHTRWNGDSKYYTKNCNNNCDYYRFIEKEARCYWGIAWKRLVKYNKMRKCEYANKPSPRLKLLGEHNRRIKELDEHNKNPQEHEPMPIYDPLGRDLKGIFRIFFYTF